MWGFTHSTMNKKTLNTPKKAQSEACFWHFGDSKLSKHIWHFYVPTISNTFFYTNRLEWKTSLLLNDPLKQVLLNPWAADRYHFFISLSKNVLFF